MSADLLPCPFCGREAGEIIHAFHPIRQKDGTLYESRSVRCSAPSFMCAGASPFCSSADKAIAAWNRRTLTIQADAREEVSGAPV